MGERGERDRFYTHRVRSNFEAREVESTLIRRLTRQGCSPEEAREQVSRMLKRVREDRGKANSPGIIGVDENGRLFYRSGVKNTFYRPEERSKTNNGSMRRGATRGSEATIGKKVGRAVEWGTAILVVLGVGAIALSNPDAQKSSYPSSPTSGLSTGPAHMIAPTFTRASEAWPTLQSIETPVKSPTKVHK